MALLWPLTGWLSLDRARLLWAAADVVSLGWLATMVMKGTGAQGFLPRAFAVLLLLSMTPTGTTIGNGQLIVFVLPIVLAGCFILLDHDPAWWRDLLAGGLLLVSLVKPSVSVPFLWLALLVTGWFRPMLLVSAGYVALTCVAASFQDASWWQLVGKSIVNGTRTAGMAIDGNLHFVLRMLGLRVLFLPTSAAVWLALPLAAELGVEAIQALVTALDLTFLIYYAYRRAPVPACAPKRTEPWTPHTAFE